MNAFNVEKIATKIKANVQGQTEPETRQIIDEREITIQLDVGYYIDYSVTPGVLKIMDNTFNADGTPKKLYNRCPNNILQFVADYKDKYGKYPDANASITRYEQNAMGEWISQASYQGKLDVRYIDNNDYAVENIKDAIQNAFQTSEELTTKINLNNTYKVHTDDWEDFITYRAVMQRTYQISEDETQVVPGYFIMQNFPGAEESPIQIKESDTIKFGTPFVFGFYPYEYNEETEEWELPECIDWGEWTRKGNKFGEAKLVDSHEQTNQFNQIELTFDEGKEARVGKKAVFDQAIWVKGESITSRGFSEISAHTELAVGKEMDISTTTGENPTLKETIMNVLFGINLSTNVNGGFRKAADNNEGMSMALHLSRFKEETEFTGDGTGSDATFVVKSGTTRTIKDFFGEHLTTDQVTREKMYLDPALKLPEIE